MIHFALNKMNIKYKIVQKVRLLCTLLNAGWI